ncbi:DUF421 domain-containing protein [Roseimaritima sediminicola]|uniref:DUF421 domain-containing protein n=1 Tax=Roseimaritima sediminicola TaxID=2662066 RepID=UPI00192A2FD7|nr:YetF domain-containing protein [Roseimaritima sediminicola]
MVLLSGLGIYVTLLLLTRLSGLRSFSKMSSFDFAITIAFGSVIASTLLTKSPSLAAGCFGLAVLFLIQFIVSRSRRLAGFVEAVVDNEPMLLMAGERILEDNLTRARVTNKDLLSHLRIAGVTHPKQVFAVVMESTGDVAVLKNSDQIDPSLFAGVRGSEQLNYDA